ncbi:MULTISPECIES: diacylglycerol kinase [Caloramator]|jgi:diacylglycerol kinase (ATP)|uniref:Diacylglycerol kinase n=1 Tax=Caloramator australicus RC3 TaxID=857293 RepID=G0V4W7_9CLOT|nr:MULTISPECIES: diacylglycerol kinase [Caloramator]MDO6354468.1 diacylglycerol kinase [Caloramator sp. CAR-1]CCC58157.1 Diacylglycerol kinase [Caloramator australicus RC3]
MKMKKITESFNHAIEGVIFAIKTQRNMRIHFAIATLVLLASLFFDLSKFEILLLFFTITLVIVLEMINTAIEVTIDLNANYYHPLAKIAKNVAAGAVLISALTSVLVGYLLFFDKLKLVTNTVIFKIKQSDPTVVFICLILITIITVVIKAFYGRGTPLKGGMPSGHSAVAFGVATAISLLTQDTLIITLAFFLAFVVAQSRVEGKIHSIYEVTVGAIIGTLVAIIIFKLL